MTSSTTTPSMKAVAGKRVWLPLPGPRIDAGLGVLVDIVPNHVGVATPIAVAVVVGRAAMQARSRCTPRRSTSTGRPATARSGCRCSATATTNCRNCRSSTASFATTTIGSRLPTAPRAARRKQVHARQHYELMNYRRADAELNYRRFFAITTLAGIRVEIPEVFAESHREIARWVQAGWVDGLRIDHPDGLADPGRLSRRSGDADRPSVCAGGKDHRRR